MRVFLDIHSLDLVAGLKGAIAKILQGYQPASIPLGFCFQRQGLGWRSAALLQVSARQQISLGDLQDRVLRHLEDNVLGLISPEEYWYFQTAVTATGWLEFQLEPDSLARWLAGCGQNMANLGHGAIADMQSTTEGQFRWQYLRQRCRSVQRLAQELNPTGSPQWQFTDYVIPSWEQALLDGTAKLCCAAMARQCGDRQLAAVEQAFWEFQRHCVLFSCYPTQPDRFWHYGAWFALLEAIATTHLGNVPDFFQESS